LIGKLARHGRVANDHNKPHAIAFREVRPFTVVVARSRLSAMLGDHRTKLRSYS
jgi:hypothetical protein